MNKTASVNLLPRKLKKLAWKRCKQQKFNSYKEYGSDVNGMFLWRGTPEGFLFWDRVYYSIYGKTKKHA